MTGRLNGRSSQRPPVKRQGAKPTICLKRACSRRPTLPSDRTTCGNSSFSPKEYTGTRSALSTQQKKWLCSQVKRESEKYVLSWQLMLIICVHFISPFKLLLLKFPGFPHFFFTNWFPWFFHFCFNQILSPVFLVKIIAILCLEQCFSTWGQDRLRGVSKLSKLKII